MKVNLRIHLKPESEVFQIDADPSETIGDLKVKIKDSQGHEVEDQQIIYLGKGLDDDMTLESCRVSEKGFLLLSLNKPIEDLPFLEELGAIEYFSLTEEQVAERLGTIPVAEICAKIPPLPPLPAEFASASGDAATTAAHVPPATAVSAFKDPSLFSSIFDSEFNSKNLPPVTTVSTFKYRPLSEILHGPSDTSASTSVPPTTTTSTPVLPTTAVSTRPFPSSLFDSDDTPKHYPPVTTVSTFRYRTLSEILANPRKTPASTTAPPTVPPATTASTSNYRPFTSSLFDSDSTSKHYPPVTTVSTFRYRTLSEILANPSKTSASTTVPPTIPPTTTASTSNYRPFTSSLFDSDSTSKHYPPVTTVSTFRYRTLSEILANPSKTSTPTVVPPTTTASTSNYRPSSSSLLDSDSTSKHYPPVTTASTFRYRPLSEILGSTSSANTAASTRVPSAATTSNYRPMSSSAASTSAQIPAVGPSNSGNVSGRPVDPRIAQFRQHITQNPELRQHFIQQISQEHPEMGQMLTQNPDMLFQFLDRMENGDVGSSSGPQVATLSVTATEKEAIDRLEGLGFPRQAVIEAYFTCDKNEQLAANYLLENA